VVVPDRDLVAGELLEGLERAEGVVVVVEDGDFHETGAGGWSAIVGQRIDPDARIVNGAETGTLAPAGRGGERASVTTPRPDSRLLPVIPDYDATVAHSRARLAVRWSLRVALACLVVFAAAPVRAWDETTPALRLSLGLDVYRAAGAMVASVRYGGNWNVKAGAWVRDVHILPEAPNMLLGGGYMWTKSKWRFGAGLVWIDGENNVNGTPWNFDASVAYDWSDRAFFEYQHYSHGTLLGLRRDVSNGGWNLFGVGLIF